MTTLLFVHGTGVRGPDYHLGYTTVSEQVRKHLPGVRLEPCLWGDEIGAKLLDQGASVPTYDSARIDPDGGEKEQRRREEVRWRLLYQDPLYEIRSLAALAGAPATGAPVVAPQAALTPQSLGQQLAAAAFSPDVMEQLRRAGHSVPALAKAAADRLVGDPVLADALAAPGLANPQVRRLPLARAFVAAWIEAAREEGLPTLSGALRERMYDEVVAHTLGGAPKGIPDLVGKAIAGLGSWVATPIARRQRTALTDAAYPAAADILLYQARGDALRGFIARRIGQIQDAVVVLAHSLGGIASFELLAAADAPKVAGLITVGSQAPFLYEMDALATVRHGTPLREDYPPWLNVYDLNDMLSYVGAGVFPKRITDVEVASRQPFPQAHSAYWTNERLWAEIKAFLG